MTVLKNNAEEDMSMEDILSSIRKYVSEEDLSKNNATYSDENTEQQNIIELDENNMSNDVLDENKEYSSQQNISDISNKTENRNTIQASPFNKLAEALRAYGKPKKSNNINFNMTVNQFVTAIVENYIQKWAAENLKSLVEQIIIREIEKLKSE